MMVDYGLEELSQQIVERLLARIQDGDHYDDDDHDDDHYHAGRLRVGRTERAGC